MARAGMSENLPHVAMATGALTLRQYTVMVLHPIAARLLDHVELASPTEAVGYIAAVVLWLVGVTLVVLNKLRASR
jgi:hypothetical protein